MFNKTVSGSNLRKSLISTPLFAVPRFSAVFSTGTLADVFMPKGDAARASGSEKLLNRDCRNGLSAPRELEATQLLVHSASRARIGDVGPFDAT